MISTAGRAPISRSPSDFPCASCRCPDECLAVRLRNSRLCALADPAGPDYRADYAELVCRGPEEPSFLAKAATFAGAVAAHVAAGMPIVDDDEHARRLDICRDCPEFIADRTACRLCGCSLIVKARWVEQHCPIDRW